MHRGTVAVVAALLLGVGARGQTSPVRTVFIIVMENHDWSSIHGSPEAPYINNQLLPMASHAEAYLQLPGVHPSLPNYLWLEAGSDFGIRADGSPFFYHRSADHLVAQLTRAGIAWKAYEEDISGTSCPLTDEGEYTTDHDPMVYFDDVTGTNNPGSAFCIAHVRPYSEFASDLGNNTVATYNFITPNLCHDMHNCGIAAGDAWLSAEVPRILNSRAYQNGGVLLITWDEDQADNAPIGMIVLSPYSKGNGYSNSVPYTHASTLRTVQEIFGVRPLLGGAASANDLGDLFSVSLAPPIAVTNAASYEHGSIAPGEIVSLFGSGIGPAAPAGAVRDGSGKIASSLGGIRVLFDSTPAPLLYAGPNQVNLVAPYEVAGKATCQIQVERQGQVSEAFVAPVAPTAPAIFTLNRSGTGAGAVLNQDETANSPSNPAPRGSTIAVFGTGAGQMNPAGVDGEVAGATSAKPLGAVSATIGGAPAEVTYAGSAPGLVSGALQVNLKIPDRAPSGAAIPVMVAIGNASSQAGVTVAIR